MSSLRALRVLRGEMLLRRIDSAARSPEQSHGTRDRRVLHHRGGPGGAAPRPHDRAGGRPAARERGRPGHRRREGDARSDQLHGAQRLRHPRPGDVAGHLRPPQPRPVARPQRRRPGDALDAAHRRPHRHHHRHLRLRPRPHHPGRHRREPHPPADLHRRQGPRARPARPRGRRPGPRRPHRGQRRPRPPGRIQGGRRHLRDHDARRPHGPPARSPPVLRTARLEDVYDRGPHQIPPPARAAHPPRDDACSCRRSSATST